MILGLSLIHKGQINDRKTVPSVVKLKKNDSSERENSLGVSSCWLHLYQKSIHGFRFMTLFDFVFKL